MILDSRNTISEWQFDVYSTKDDCQELLLKFQDIGALREVLREISDTPVATRLRESFPLKLTLSTPDFDVECRSAMPTGGCYPRITLSSYLGPGRTQMAST